jgi:hypothetical protein
MKRTAVSALTLVLLLALAGCAGDRIEKTDGTVILAIRNFDGLPVVVNVSQAVNVVTIASLTLSNTPKNPRGNTSSLMDVEIQTYQVTYQRLGTGTRVPPTLVRDLFGFAPVDGTSVFNNLPIVTLDQLLNAPLSDLQISNGGFDRETNSQVITLNLTLTFFGRTIAGDNVATEPVSFTVDFLP